MPSCGPGRRLRLRSPVIDDASLDASVGEVRQRIAWVNSPRGDAYQIVEATVDDHSFDNLALLSTVSAALGRWPDIRDDGSLDSANGVLAQVIAWQNSPAGDAFLAAQTEPMVDGADFQRVALASFPYSAAE